MELALHLGMTADGLEQRMAERELDDWRLFVEERMLPWRRIQLQLAQIAQHIAVTMGGAKNTQLQDFLFDPKPAANEEGGLDLDAKDIAAFFGAKVIKIKKAATPNG